MTTPMLGPHWLQPNDWLSDSELAWWCSKTAAIQRARQLVQSAQLAYESEHDVRYLPNDGEGYAILASVGDNDDEHITVDPEFVLDLGECR